MSSATQSIKRSTKAVADSETKVLFRKVVSLKVKKEKEGKLVLPTGNFERTNLLFFTEDRALTLGKKGEIANEHEITKEPYKGVGFEYLLTTEESPFYRVFLMSEWKNGIYGDLDLVQDKQVIEINVEESLVLACRSQLDVLEKLLIHKPVLPSLEQTLKTVHHLYLESPSSSQKVDIEEVIHGGEDELLRQAKISSSQSLHARFLRLMSRENDDGSALQGSVRTALQGSGFGVVREDCKNRVWLAKSENTASNVGPRNVFPTCYCRNQICHLRLETQPLRAFGRYFHPNGTKKVLKLVRDEKGADTKVIAVLYQMLQDTTPGDHGGLKVEEYVKSFVSFTEHENRLNRIKASNRKVKENRANRQMIAQGRAPVERDCLRGAEKNCCAAGSRDCLRGGEKNCCAAGSDLHHHDTVYENLPPMGFASKAGPTTQRSLLSL